MTSHYKRDWYGEKTKHRQERNITNKIAIQEMRESNTALCGNQGFPQLGTPRSHRASHAGINSHKSWVKHGTSNDTVTWSAERWNERWDRAMVRSDGRASTSQSPLRIHSGVLFQASASLNLVLLELIIVSWIRQLCIVFLWRDARTILRIRFKVLNRLMTFFEVLVTKASAILFPVLKLVGDSGRYNTILKVTQCPRLLGTNQWLYTNPLEF